MSHRVFVTGGAGFIGSAFVDHVLRTTDGTVTVYDSLTYAASPTNLVPFHDDPRFRFVLGDVTDRVSLREAMADHDVVVHLAAESHVDRSLVDPERFFRTNRDGTATVCEVASEVGIRRLLHMSTDEVYGSIATGSFSETDPTRPTTPYAVSKAQAEQVVQDHVRRTGLDVVITRGCNVFGPRQHPEKFIPLFLTRLLSGEPAPLHGDGGHVRDWLAVGDTCIALELLIRRGVAGEIYNIAAGNERTSRQVADRLVALVGVDPAYIETVDDRSGNDRRYSLDRTKLAQLGWRPAANFDEALVDTARWYRDNRTWWEPLLADMAPLAHRA